MGAVISYLLDDQCDCPNLDAITKPQKLFRQEEGEAAGEDVCSQVILIGDSSCARSILMTHMAGLHLHQGKEKG